MLALPLTPTPLSPKGRARVIESCARTWATLWPGLRATPRAIEYAASAPCDADGGFAVRYAILRLGTGPDLLAEGQALVEEITAQALFGSEMSRRRTWPGAAASEPFPWITHRSSTRANAALIGADPADAIDGAHIDNDAAEWKFGRSGATPKARGWCMHVHKAMCFGPSGSVPERECAYGRREAVEEMDATRAMRADLGAHRVFRMRASNERPSAARAAHAHVRLTHGAVHRYLNPERSRSCPFCQVIPANIGTTEAPVFVIDERQCALPLGV